MAPKPSQDQFRALAEMRNSAPINTLLTDWKSRVVETLAAATEPMALYRAQGELATITELLKLMQTAPDQLKR